MGFFNNNINALVNTERLKEIVKTVLNDDINKKAVKPEITIGIQLLLMHYLDLLNNINCNNQKKSGLLSVLFKTEGDENIRKSLSNIGGTNSKYLTKENLNYLLALFKKLKLDDLQKKVQKDIDKLDKKITV